MKIYNEQLIHISTSETKILDSQTQLLSVFVCVWNKSNWVGLYTNVLLMIIIFSANRYFSSTTRHLS
jgi:hypothetical protein